MVTNPDNPHRQRVFAHWDLLSQLAKRRFPERGSAAASNLAEEASLYMLNRLEEDDWLRVRQHREQSSFRTFLAQVAQRLLEDFWRQKYGRPRVPAWIKALGPLWERAYRKLCRERLPAPTVIEEMRATFDPGRDPAALEEIVAAIRARIIDCGALPADKAEQLMADFPDAFDVEGAAGPAARTPSVEEGVVAEQRAGLLKAIAEWLDDERAAGSGAAPDDNPLAAALRNLRDRLRFTPEERLLLRLVYQEGMTVTDAGKHLGLGVNSVQGKMRRLLEHIRSTLRAVGLDRTLAEAITEEELES